VEQSLSRFLDRDVHRKRRDRHAERDHDDRGPFEGRDRIARDQQRAEGTNDGHQRREHADGLAADRQRSVIQREEGAAPDQDALKQELPDDFLHRRGRDSAGGQAVMPRDNNHRRGDAYEGRGDDRVEPAPLDVDEVARAEGGREQEHGVAYHRRRHRQSPVRRNQDQSDADADDRDSGELPGMDMNPVSDEPDQRDPCGDRARTERRGVAGRRELQPEHDARRHPPAVQKREREAGQPVGFRYFMRVHHQKWREKQTAATQPKKQQVRRRERRRDAKPRQRRIDGGDEDRRQRREVPQGHRLAV